MVVTRSLRLKPTEADQAWTMDFVADQLSSGAKIRALTIVDVFSREALAIEVGSRLRSEHVVAALDRLVAAGRKPKYLFVDNGSEFSGRLLTCGHTGIGPTSTSVGQVNRPTTLTSNPSMDRFAMNA